VNGFQVTSETPARVANAATAAAKAKGSERHDVEPRKVRSENAEQFDALVSKKVDAISSRMGKHG